MAERLGVDLRRLLRAAEAFTDRAIFFGDDWVKTFFFEVHRIAFLRDLRGPFFGFGFGLHGMWMGFLLCMEDAKGLVGRVALARDAVVWKSWRNAKKFWATGFISPSKGESPIYDG